MSRMKDLWEQRRRQADLFGEPPEPPPPPPPKPPPPPGPTAREARDEALERVKVSSGEWFDDAMTMLRGFPPGTEGIFEEFRLWMGAKGLPKPHKPNAWGSLCRTAISWRVLEKTGERRQMRTVRSHARETDVLRRTP